MDRYYIFEDDGRDDIQKLFRHAYRDTEVNFLYQLGGGNIPNKIENDIDKSSQIYVFIDLVPDNPSTVILYNKLRVLKNEGYQIITFPIPCAEYYIIKMITKYSGYASSDIDVVLNNDVYYNADILDSDINNYTRTFERFCKRILSSYPLVCIHKSNEEDRANNALKGKYYRGDCACSECTLAKLDLQMKSENLLSEYPCIPTGSMMLYHKFSRLSWEECINIHRKLVDDYNRTVIKYREYKGKSKIDISYRKYKTIYYMY